MIISPKEYSLSLIMDCSNIFIIEWHIKRNYHVIKLNPLY